jgi:SAM-dependent methyltransferase
LSFKSLIFNYQFIRRFGLLAYFKKHYFNLNNWFFDFYYGVETKGVIPSKNLGISNGDSIQYMALDYYFIKKAFREIPIRTDEVQLLDYGCGKGRALVVAARMNFKKVVGVELSSLSSLATDNLNSMSGKYTKNTRVLQVNAIDFDIPDGINVIYFFHPFVGETLVEVINKIEMYIKSKSQKVYVIYFNNQEFDRLTRAKKWLNKIEQSHHHLGLSCGIYKAEG